MKEKYDTNPRAKQKVSKSLIMCYLVYIIFFTQGQQFNLEMQIYSLNESRYSWLYPEITAGEWKTH